MITTALDTNIILSVLTGDATEVHGGHQVIKAAGQAGQLVTSVIVYAEVAANFPSQSRADDFFRLLNCRIEPLEDATAFLAAQFFWQYKRRGGGRSRILPDFLIAAHAQLRADRLLTRDKRFFKEAFPKLRAVSPDDLV